MNKKDFQNQAEIQYVKWYHTLRAIEKHLALASCSEQVGPRFSVAELANYMSTGPFLRFPVC